MLRVAENYHSEYTAHHETWWWKHHAVGMLLFSRAREAGTS